MTIEFGWQVAMRNLVLAVASVGVIVVPASTAEAAPECAPTQQIDPVRLLRQASLDLRGKIPTFDELEAVRTADDPREEVDRRIEAMFDSDDYAAQVRGYHQGLIWSALPDSLLQRLVGPARLLGRQQGRLRINNRANRYRGHREESCLNQLQTEFDANGMPVPIETFTDPTCSLPGNTCVREGYVMVEPYWAPGTEVRVCAFDAQTALVSSNGLDCSDYGATNRRECGCGENLQWCATLVDDLDEPFREALVEEPLKIFESVVMEDRSYLEAFTGGETFVNGVLAHFYRHHTGVDNQDLSGPVAYEAGVGDLPDKAFGDPTWTRIDREGMHAGVLTTMSWLVRFASNRSRANRFYEAFYCDPFVPPEGGLPPEEAVPNPNLRERTGCDGCHGTLEPAAAHWGRWRTGGDFGYFDPSYMSFDEPRADCMCGEGAETECSAACSNYFVTQDNAHPDEYEQFGGLPLAAAWLTPEDEVAVAAGPAALVDTPQEREQIARCMVRNLANRMLGRDLDTGDLEWLEEQTQAVIDGGFVFNDLVRRLLEDRRYRTID